MTNPTITEQDLIARLEKATGPDRALWDEVNDYAWKAHWIDTARHLVNRTLIEQAFVLPDDNLLLAIALTLVPEGLQWSVHSHDGFGKCEAWLHSETQQQEWQGHAATPANALCIAALRASAPLTTTEGR